MEPDKTQEPEGNPRPMSPEQYAKEIRNAYLAVGLLAFVFFLITIGVTISWW